VGRHSRSVYCERCLITNNPSHTAEEPTSKIDCLRLLLTQRRHHAAYTLAQAITASTMLAKGWWGPLGEAAAMMIKRFCSKGFRPFSSRQFRAVAIGLAAIGRECKHVSRSGFDPPLQSVRLPFPFRQRACEIIELRTIVDGGKGPGDSGQVCKSLEPRARDNRCIEWLARNSLCGEISPCFDASGRNVGVKRDRASRFSN